VGASHAAVEGKASAADGLRPDCYRARTCSGTGQVASERWSTQGPPPRGVPVCSSAGTSSLHGYHLG